MAFFRWIKYSVFVRLRRVGVHRHFQRPLCASVCITSSQAIFSFLRASFCNAFLSTGRNLIANGKNSSVERTLVFVRDRTVWVRFRIRWIRIWTQLAFSSRNTILFLRRQFSHKNQTQWINNNSNDFSAARNKPTKKFMFAVINCLSRCSVARASPEIS